MYIFIDIETVPAVDWSKQKIFEETRKKVPANYKDKDKISSWVIENMEETFEKTSFDFKHGWVASVAICGLTDQPRALAGVKTQETDRSVLLEQEKEMLFGLQDSVSELRGRNLAKFVGWNVPFDLMWLWHASLRAGALKLAETIVPRGSSKFKLPWIDLMEYFSCFQYGKSSKQTDVAEYLGIAEPRPDLAGSQVYQQWKKGDTSYIDHNISDVLTLRMIAEKIGALL